MVLGFVSKAVPSGRGIGELMWARQGLVGGPEGVGESGACNGASPDTPPHPKTR